MNEKKIGIIVGVITVIFIGHQCYKIGVNKTELRLNPQLADCQVKHSSEVTDLTNRGKIYAACLKGVGFEGEDCEKLNPFK